MMENADCIEMYSLAQKKKVLDVDARVIAFLKCIAIWSLDLAPANYV
jgi:hypothetical protein